MAWKVLGSELVDVVIEALNNADVEDKSREKVYDYLFQHFADDNHDLEECIGNDNIFDKVYAVYCEKEEEDLDIEQDEE